MKNNKISKRFPSNTILPKMLVFPLILSFLMFSLLAGESYSSQNRDENYSNGSYALQRIENKTSRSYNVTLLICDWDKRLPLQGLNISIYDLNGDLIFSGISNSTGYLSVKLEEKPYSIIVRSDNRIVGCQMIHVNASKVFLIRVWAYTLKITCVDLEGDYLPGVIVLLYDQSSSSIDSNINRSWQLVNVAKADGNGTVIFNNVWNGTYKITVKNSKIIGEKIVNVTKSDHITIKCNKTSLEIRVVTSTPIEYPLPNASVLLQDSIGHPFLKGYTDENGFIRFDNVYADNYKIFVDWMGVEVFSEVVNTNTTKDLKAKASVFEASLRIIGPSGNPLPHSKIVLKKISGRLITKTLELKADENGFAFLLLPSGTYEISCFYGIYSGGITVNLVDNFSGTIQCNIHPNVWFLLFLVSLPLSLLSLVIERKKLKKPLEYKRYQNMLSKLESMYNSGLVKYKIYRKLREEYEAKLMELGGRKGR